MRVLNPLPRQHLSVIVRDFVKDYPSFNTMDGAYNKCKFASYELVLHLRRQGYEAKLVHVKGFTNPELFTEPHAKWLETDRKEWSHYLVGIGTWAVDVTARQFDENAQVPIVRPLGNLGDDWELVETDKFLNAWVDEVLEARKV